MQQEKSINVLSLFDGISSGQIALERAGIKIDNYFASEIDKQAIKVTQHNYPDTIQLGDVTKVKSENLPKIQLLIGGSPCQGFSFAGKQLNFEDPRSKLFFEYVRLLGECKPSFFLLENVKMKKESEKVISDYLGVEPIEINSALVSAQNRKRLYWTNIPNIEQPEDKGVYFKDILDREVSKYSFISDDKVRNKAFTKNYLQYDINGRGNKSQSQRACYLSGKHLCLDTTAASNAKVFDGERVRKITRLETERLQTVPENYTLLIKENLAKKALGNGWTVDVISHIFKNIPESIYEN